MADDRAHLPDPPRPPHEILARLALAGRSWLLWPPLFAVTAGAGAWGLAHPKLLQAFDDNKLGEPDRLRMLGWVAVAAAALAVVYAAVFGWARIVRPGSVVATLAGLTRRLSPLLAVPLVPALSVAGIERDRPNLALFLITVAGVVAARSLHAWAPAPREPDEPASPGGDRLRDALAAVAVLGLWAAYGAFFSRLSLLNHHGLHTHTVDLGYYDNVFYQSSHGRPLGCSLMMGGTHAAAHFDPLLVVLSPLYRLYPRAETLLVLQAVWLGAGVVPVYLLARQGRLSRLGALGLSAAYGMHPAVHGANLYEFHSLTLLGPMVLLAVYLLQRGARWPYYALLAPVLLCREDAALLMVFVGLHGVLLGGARRGRLGLVTVLVSVVYFLVAKRFFMHSPDLLNGGDSSYSYAYYYEDLIPNRNGSQGFAVSLLTNPVFVLRTVLAEPKLQYLLELFLPLGLLPFLARPGRVLLVYGLVFTLLASRPAVFSLHFQYTSMVLPVAIAVVPSALGRLRDSHLAAQLGFHGPSLARAVLGGALVAGVLVSWKFGAIVPNDAFHGGFAPILHALTPGDEARYAWIEEQAARIPREASVEVTNHVGAHVSNRWEVRFYPTEAGRPPADYVFADDSELSPVELEHHKQDVARGELTQLSRYERFALYKRKERAPPRPATPPPWPSSPTSSSPSTSPRPPAPP